MASSFISWLLESKLASLPKYRIQSQVSVQICAGNNIPSNTTNSAVVDDKPKGESPDTKVNVDDAVVAKAPDGEEVDFKKLSIEDALKALKVRRLHSSFTCASSRYFGLVLQLAPHFLISVDSVQVHDGGLTTAEAEQRQQEYGKNKLPESTRNPFLVYLGYMWNPLSWAMEVAAIIAIALLDYADFCLIIALLFLNATISFVEESNADKAIKALTAALAPKCKCLRNGTVETMESIELVPGDIVVVRLGEIVPADIKLMGEQGEDDHPLQVLVNTTYSCFCYALAELLLPRVCFALKI